MSSQKTSPPITVEYCSVFADILSQAITGELIGMANYAAMVRLYPDAEEQCEALAHAANELGHAKAFRLAADDLGVRPIVNLEAPYWRRLRQAFLRYVDAGDRIACVIIQEVMLESFAVSMYHAVADEAHEEMAKVFRAIGDEEEGHVDHAIAELHDALAADRDAFENKLEILHNEVMTTLAEMLGARDTVPHCGLCKGDCVKESLHHVGLDRATLRGLALNHYLRTLDRIGVRGDRSLSWAARLPV
jgi:fatty aldehyde decarbonylase